LCKVEISPMPEFLHCAYISHFLNIKLSNLSDCTLFSPKYRIKLDLKYCMHLPLLDRVKALQAIRLVVTTF